MFDNYKFPVRGHTMNTSKEALLLATISVIERKGIQAVTVRDIAMEANVNVAAVNYHFGAKDKLLEETLKVTMQNALVDWKDMLEREYRTPHELFTDIFNYSLDGIIRYPNITRAHLHDAIIKNEYHGLFITKFKVFLVSLADKVEFIGSGRNREYIELSIVHMFSALLFAGLAPGLYSGLKKFRIHTAPGRRKFVEHLISANWNKVHF
jgi:TetR/AcrR family transcriptional regulator, regulator of cefoperazone and chloramphenicol sensitivity